MEISTDENSFGGSNDEHRIFKEIFSGYITDGPVANNKPQSGNCLIKSDATICEPAPLLTVKEVHLKDSDACGLSKFKDFKRKKSSISQGNDGKNCLENALNLSVVHLDSASTVLYPGSDSSSPQDTFRVLEYSLYSGQSGSNVTTAAAEPLVNIVGDGGGQPNLVSNPENNLCKDSEAVGQATSPTSQESTGSKAVVTNDGSNSKSINNGNPEDDELLADVSIRDARDQLFNVVSRLMEAKGWHVEVVQRACRTYKEKNYIHEKQKRRVREFHKLWRLLGWSFCVNDNPGVVENNYKCWPDLGHYCKDLSLMLAQNDLTVNPTASDSELARLWNILDPFVYVMFIYRKVRALRNATAIQSSRSIPLNAIVKYTGELTYDEITPVQKKKSSIKRKLQPSDTSLSTNNASQNENAGSEGIFSFGEVLGEASNPKKSKNARCKTMVTSRGKDNRKLNHVEQREDNAELIISEKVTGVDGSLFKSSLYDVHSDSIKEWVSQNELTEQAKLVHELPPNHMENYTAVGTTTSQHSNKKDAILDYSVHSFLRQYGISLVEKEILDSSDVTVSVDPFMGEKMLNGSMEEYENDVNSLHKSAVIWKEQKDFTQSKRTVVEVDAITNGNKGRPFVPSKQIGEEMGDDDILLSAIKKKNKKRGRPPKGGSASKLKVRSVKTKPKVRGRGRKLHPRSGGGKGKHQEEDEKCITSGARTPLSWLIDSGVVNLDDTIMYRKPRSNDVVKQGFITKHGILCYCCDETYSLSNFRLHAESKSSGACSNLFTESGTPYSLCQLNGWSLEYLKRKSHKKPTQLEDEDEGDDICGLCGDGGDLVCCDNCPATFHKNCLSAQELPEGDWYCFSCVCHICGEFSRAGSTKRLKCAQCEHNYHASCIMDENVTCDVTDGWFCSAQCHNLHSDVRSRVGVMVPLANGYSSTLLRCSYDKDEDADDKSFSHAQMSNSFSGDCHTKLAVALTIMEECFLSMIDSRTGIDMIPHMVYNFGSTFPRLDFDGFYTVILEKDDVIMCVATLRIRGSSIAEIPLVATCSKYRRQGMCRLLMGSIEEMLKALKIENIIMSAVPELVPTWVNGFGFQPVEDDEKSSLKTLNLVVFPGTVSLKKSILQAEPMLQVEQPVSSVDTIPVLKTVSGTNVLQLSDWHTMWSEPDTINAALNVVV